MIAFIMCIYRYRRRPGSDRYARWQCSESYAECEGNCACRGMCQHKDSHCLWYETALGASSALVSILDSSQRQREESYNLEKNVQDFDWCSYILVVIFPRQEKKSLT